MNRAEYTKYQANVERNLKGLEFISTGACPGCDECGLDHDAPQAQIAEASEAHFSWRSCECCGSSLGGNREPAHGYIKRDEGRALLVHMDVCTDCVYFINYGKLDDQTMMEMEKGQQ